MRERGHEFNVSGHETYVVVNSKHYTIRCREKCYRQTITEGSWTRTGLVPNGKLSLKLDGLYDKEWNDTRTPIEDKLAQIVAAFELKAEDDIAREARWKDDREESQKRQEIKDRLEAEIAWGRQRVEILKSHAVEWNQAHQMKAFIKEIEKNISLTELVPEQVIDWLDWANRIEESTNPLSKGVNHLVNQYSSTSNEDRLS